MIDLAPRNSRVRRHLHGRAVLRRNHPAADEITDLIRRKLFSSQHRKHAGHACRWVRVDAFDGGMRVRRAHKTRMTLPRSVDVVGVMPPACDKPMIFFPTHRRADPRCGHWTYLPRKRLHMACSGG